ncbi:hypothetical protein TNCV_3066001 [Trichonephila clavipes]|uniref:Uncharacterized protein n=1 Tax=Trichonephila clavipes TaxID=2585209 RepID=A0A8X6V7V4_TRICX|nr:hypothetical protein TNCV_3066001 [Trichonephila clavipes]
MQTASSQNNSMDGVGFQLNCFENTRKRQASMPKAFSETLLARDDASQTDIAEKDEEGNSIDQDEPDIGEKSLLNHLKL